MNLQILFVLVNKYKIFRQTLSLRLLKSNRLICSTSSLSDHIPTNSFEIISQNGVIDAGISDDQLIYCTRKIKRIKQNMHKNCIKNCSIFK